MSSSGAYTKGLILKLTNIGVVGVIDGRKDDDFKPESDQQKDQIVSRELLTDIFREFGQVKHTEFRMGQDWCTIRYSERDVDAAKKALARFATEPLVLGKKEVKMEVLEGDEEKDVWDVIINGRDGRMRDRGFRGDRFDRGFRGDRGDRERGGYDRGDRYGRGDDAYDRRDDRRRNDYYRPRDDDSSSYRRSRDDEGFDRRDGRDRRDDYRRYDDYDRKDRREDDRRDRREDDRRDRREDDRRDNKEQDW